MGGVTIQIFLNQPTWVLLLFFWAANVVSFPIFPLEPRQKTWGALPKRSATSDSLGLLPHRVHRGDFGSSSAGPGDQRRSGGFRIAAGGSSIF